MNTTTRIAAAAIALLGSALLNTPAFAADTSKTRAQVIAEYEQARADGSFYIDAGDGTPRGLARARLAEREQRERQARTELAERSAKAGS